MALSEFEITKLTELVAGRLGQQIDPKTLRQVVDRVVDSLQQQRGNPSIEGATCEVPVARTPSASVTQQYRSRTPRPPDQELLSDRGGLYEQIERTDRTRIIVAAFGKNRPGIVAAITNVLADLACSIEDISQTILQDFFSMIMVVDIAGSKADVTSLRDRLQSTESQFGMKVFVMHEDIFRYMHRI